MHVYGGITVNAERACRFYRFYRTVPDASASVLCICSSVFIKVLPFERWTLCFEGILRLDWDTGYCTVSGKCLHIN